MQPAHLLDLAPTLEENTVKHLVYYLQGTASYTFTYSLDNMSNEPFTTFSDADHSRCKDNGCLTVGYITKLGTGAISWSSKLQGIVTLSSTKAEYSATIEAGKEICWMINLLSELGFKSDKSSSLHIDNQLTIQVTKNPEYHGHMKQLDLKFFWLYDNIEQRKISPEFMQIEQMPADILTKALPKVKIELFSKMIGISKAETTQHEQSN